MLAIRVNLSSGVLVFVARLAPVRNLTTDYLFEIVKSVHEVVHDAGG